MFSTIGRVTQWHETFPVDRANSRPDDQRQQMLHRLITWYRQRRQEHASRHAAGPSSASWMEDSAVSISKG